MISYTVAGLAAYFLSLPNVRNQFWVEGQTAQLMKNYITQTGSYPRAVALNGNNGVAYPVAYNGAT